LLAHKRDLQRFFPTDRTVAPEQSLADRSAKTEVETPGEQAEGDFPQRESLSQREIADPEGAGFPIGTAHAPQDGAVPGAKISLRGTEGHAAGPSGGKVEPQVVDRKPPRLPDEDRLDRPGVKRSRQKGRWKHKLRSLGAGDGPVHSRSVTARIKEQTGLCDPELPDPGPIPSLPRQHQIP